MALSNWDTLAVDEHGNPTNGVFVSPMGVAVKVYKNWLFVEDEKGWAKGGRFVEPIVMEVQVGHLVYKDVAVYAVRGPKIGIYFAVWVGHEARSAMLGIGCYGYKESEPESEEEVPYLGIEHAEVEHLKALLKAWAEACDIPEELVQVPFERALRFCQGDAFFIGPDSAATKPGEAEKETILTQIIPRMAGDTPAGQAGAAP